MTATLDSWSRRRAAVAAEAAAEEQAAIKAAEQKQLEALAEKSDEDILEELGLPDPDSLGLGDDFKGFMAKTVPNHIRKRALRQLWRSNPVLACIDGLNDYDDDYLTGSFGQGAIKTSYQVGKGMLAHLVEVERQKELAAEPTVADDSDAEEAEVECAEEAEPELNTEIQPLAAADEDAVDDAAAAMPRRMRFQFSEDTA